MSDIIQLGINGLDVRRTGRVTGSRIAGILGISPYATRESVIREMVREHFGAETEFTGNAATRYGSEHEVNALAWYEETKGVMTYDNQEFIIHPVHDFLAVTIDGRVEGGLVECKAPYRSAYKSVPEYYIPQIQLQMACAGADWCDFVCWRSDGSGFIERVYANNDYIEQNMPTILAFMAEFEETIKDKAKSKSFLVDKGRSDAEWRTAAAEYIQAKADADAASVTLKAAQERIIELAGGQSAKGFGVQVIKTERKGMVKYSEVVKELLPNTDLTAWQGEPTVFFSVKVSE